MFNTCGSKFTGWYFSILIFEGWDMSLMYDGTALFQYLKTVVVMLDSFRNWEPIYFSKMDRTYVKSEWARPKQ